MDPHPSTQDPATRISIGNLVVASLGTVIGVTTLLFGALLIVGGVGASNESSGTASTSGPPASAPSATPSMKNGVATILIKPGAVNPMTYDTPAFTVKSGQPVSVTFSNISPVPLQHNLCICKPGSKDAMLAESVKIMADPQGLAKGFIPDTPLILWHTRLLNPNESQTLEFTPPSPGEYPFLCTFPGHATLMNGVMKAE